MARTRQSRAVCRNPREKEVVSPPDLQKAIDGDKKELKNLLDSNFPLTVVTLLTLNLKKVGRLGADNLEAIFAKYPRDKEMINFLNLLDGAQNDDIEQVEEILEVFPTKGGEVIIDKVIGSLPSRAPRDMIETLKKAKPTSRIDDSLENTSSSIQERRSRSKTPESKGLMRRSASQQALSQETERLRTRSGSTPEPVVEVSLMNQLAKLQKDGLDDKGIAEYFVEMRSDGMEVPSIYRLTTAQQEALNKILPLTVATLMGFAAPQLSLGPRSRSSGRSVALDARSGSDSPASRSRSPSPRPRSPPASPGSSRPSGRLAPLEKTPKCPVPASPQAHSDWKNFDIKWPQNLKNEDYAGETEGDDEIAYMPAGSRLEKALNDYMWRSGSLKEATTALKGATPGEINAGLTTVSEPRGGKFDPERFRKGLVMLMEAGANPYMMPTINFTETAGVGKGATIFEDVTGIKFEEYEDDSPSPQGSRSRSGSAKQSRPVPASPQINPTWEGSNIKWPQNLENRDYAGPTDGEDDGEDEKIYLPAGSRLEEAMTKYLWKNGSLADLEGGILQNATPGEVNAALTSFSEPYGAKLDPERFRKGLVMLMEAGANPYMQSRLNFTEGFGDDRELVIFADVTGMKLKMSEEEMAECLADNKTSSSGAHPSWSEHKIAQPWNLKNTDYAGEVEGEDDEKIYLPQDTRLTGPIEDFVFGKGAERDFLAALKKATPGEINVAIAYDVHAPGRGSNPINLDHYRLAVEGLMNAGANPYMMPANTIPENIRAIIGDISPEQAEILEDLIGLKA